MPACCDAPSHPWDRWQAERLWMPKHLRCLIVGENPEIRGVWHTDGTRPSSTGFEPLLTDEQSRLFYPKNALERQATKPMLGAGLIDLNPSPMGSGELTSVGPSPSVTRL
jgi:hypothetical protein